MSEHGGYLQEQDLIEECATRIAHECYLWSQRSPTMSLPEEAPYSIMADAVIKVLTRRQLLNDLGIEQIRKAGIKPPEQVSRDKLPSKPA